MIEKETKAVLKAGCRLAKGEKGTGGGRTDGQKSRVEGQLLEIRGARFVKGEIGQCGFLQKYTNKLENKDNLM